MDLATVKSPFHLWEVFFESSMLAFWQPPYFGSLEVTIIGKEGRMLSYQLKLATRAVPYCPQ